MEEKKFKLSSTFAAILTFSAICSFCGCSPQTGVRSGQVLNAINNEPIQGIKTGAYDRRGAGEDKRLNGSDHQ